MPTSFEELEVWKAGIALTVLVYRVTRAFPRDELFGLTTQMRRAASSVPANIAEGQGRSTRREYQRFVGMAIGSANELLTHAHIAQELGYGSEGQWAQLARELTTVRRMLYALRASLNRPPKSEQQAGSP
jgi:four helix bundle protein